MVGKKSMFPHMGIWLKIAWKSKSGPKVPYPRSYPISTARGGHVHLEVPWEWHLGSKLKIYVETIYCEHFVFYWKKKFVSHFSDFVYWKLPIFWRFWPKPVFVQIMKRYWQKLSKNLSQMGFQAFFIHTFSLFGQKQVLVKIIKNVAIFCKQSLKNYEQFFSL